MERALVLLLLANSPCPSLRYAGDWVDGKRHGHGTSRYDGKFGYDRWEGPFADDKAHGAGTMFLEEGEPMAFEFKMGERSTKWEKPLRSLE